MFGGLQPIPPAKKKSSQLSGSKMLRKERKLDESHNFID